MLLNQHEVLETTQTFKVLFVLIHVNKVCGKRCERKFISENVTKNLTFLVTFGFFNGCYLERSSAVQDFFL